PIYSSRGGCVQMEHFERVLAAIASGRSGNHKDYAMFACEPCGGATRVDATAGVRRNCDLLRADASGRGLMVEVNAGRGLMGARGIVLDGSANVDVDFVGDGRRRNQFEPDRCSLGKCPQWNFE